MKVTGGIVNIFADGKWNWGQIKRAFQLGMKLDFPWLNWTSSFTNIHPLCGGRGGFWKRRQFRLELLKQFYNKLLSGKLSCTQFVEDKDITKIVIIVT